MINKRILPEGFDFGIPPVEIINCGSRGLDKTAMEKRAGSFDDTIQNIKGDPHRTYLHVISTGAYETYSSNNNGDGWNEKSFDLKYPYPENKNRTHDVLDGGLSKYHDKTYMNKAAVYQEHHVKDSKPSGEIIAAHYNNKMHRGELLIAVDTDKWAPRLQKKAMGQDIYLSIGARVPRDLCVVCGRQAKTASEHCEHFTKKRCQLMDDGTRCCVMNDSPDFYDISGVDVPADRIAFVLRKVASGSLAKTASSEAITTLSARVPMVFTKSAAILQKLSKMEKKLESVVADDLEHEEEPAFVDDENAQKDFILRVENYPSDEIIDGCNRRGILLSPGMLFKLLGKDCESPLDQIQLISCDDDSCGDCSAMMRELEDDEDTRNDILLDGSFDQHFIPDIGLENVLESFMPEFSMQNPEVESRTIHIVITGRRPRKRRLNKRASITVQAQEALRRTYARYFISFAAQNNDATCLNALRKVAGYGK